MSRKLIAVAAVVSLAGWLLAAPAPSETVTPIDLKAYANVKLTDNFHSGDFPTHDGPDRITSRPGLMTTSPFGAMPPGTDSAPVAVPAPALGAGTARGVPRLAYPLRRRRTSARPSTAASDSTPASAPAEQPPEWCSGGGAAGPGFVTAAP